MATSLPPIPPKLQALGRSVVRWLEDAIKVITTADTTLATHTALTDAHGSNGTIVGANDLATTGTAGLVKKSTASTDASSSAVSVTSADVAAAGAAYSQAHTNTIVTLANETKADVNTLVTDVNAIATSLNDLKARLRTAGVLST
ncbi:MAG: hypothetical protein E6Q97_33815 [Desulfurellales bacterium]|nr:MAG: hypothetical protein E6Q97_33815 [Desulfurellales bacterium]